MEPWTLAEDGVVLRPWALRDIDALPALANDPAVAANLRDAFPHPYTRAHATEWVAYGVSYVGEPLDFAITLGPAEAPAPDTLVGAIHVKALDDVHRYTAGIGYWVGRRYWGRGVATRAVRAIVRYGFDTLGMVRLQAEVYAWNAASARVLEKAGFVREARLRRHVYKDGRLDDLLLYARVREEPHAGPPR